MKEGVKPKSILVGTDVQAFSEVVVCSGATCVCTGNPSAFATLSITTNQKYYINAVDKLIATVEDNQFVSGLSPFQQCKHKKGKNKTCTYQPFGIWNIVGNESTRSIDGRGILTKNGILRCAKGGVLSIRTSGQVEGVEQNEKCIKGLPCDYREESTPTKKVDLVEHSIQPSAYASKVYDLTLTNLEQLHCGHLVRDNTRALRIQKGDELIFTASTNANEESKNISWSVLYAKGGSSILEDGKTGKTIVLHTAGDQYETFSTKHRAFSWQPQKAGVYIIAVNTTPQLKVQKTYKEAFYYYFEVVDDATITSLQLSVKKEDTLVVGDRVNLVLHSDIKLSSQQINQLCIKVSAKDVHPGNHTAFVFTSKGAQSFKQKGTTLQATFDCVNVNTYQVEVYKNLMRHTAIPTQYFNVGSTSLLAIFPPLESVRIGSRIVFSAMLKSKGIIKPQLIRWFVKVPDGEFFQEHFIKDVTVPLTFSKKGYYVIKCVYDPAGEKKKNLQHTIRVVANALEKVVLLPSSFVSSLKDNKYKIYCNNRVKVILGTTIGYQPPTTEPAYVEVQTRDGSTLFTRIIQCASSPLEKRIIRSKHICTDTEIVWTLSYIKGPKKKIGFGLSIYYTNSKPQPQLKTLRDVKQVMLQNQKEIVVDEVLEPKSTYPIYTQTGRIVLRSNRAQFDFKFEDAGLYQLDVTLNHTTKSYEIECI